MLTTRPALPPFDGATARRPPGGRRHDFAVPDVVARHRRPPRSGSVVGSQRRAVALPMWWYARRAILDNVSVEGGEQRNDPPKLDAAVPRRRRSSGSSLRLGFVGRAVGRIVASAAVVGANPQGVNRTWCPQRRRLSTKCRRPTSHRPRQPQPRRCVCPAAPSACHDTYTAHSTKYEEEIERVS